MQISTSAASWSLMHLLVRHASHKIPKLIAQAMDAGHNTKPVVDQSCSPQTPQPPSLPLPPPSCASVHTLSHTGCPELRLLLCKTRSCLSLRHIGCRNLTTHNMVSWSGLITSLAAMTSWKTSSIARKVQKQDCAPNRNQVCPACHLLYHCAPRKEFQASHNLCL